MPEMMPDWLETFEAESARRPSLTCPECDGRGFIVLEQATNGENDFDRCPVCGGCGYVHEETHAQAA